MSRIHSRTPADSWWTTNIPGTGPTGTATTWVGNFLKFTKAGRVAGFRAYEQTGAAPETVICQLIDDAPTTDLINRLGIMKYAASSPPKWHQCWFRPWYRVVVGDLYLLAVLYIGGGFYRNNAALGAGAVTRNGIQLVNGFQSTALDLSGASITTNTNANAVDVLFYPD